MRAKAFENFGERRTVYNAWIATALTATLFGASDACAHFTWLDSDGSGRVVFFFGENPADRDYRLPEALARAEIWHVDASGERRLVEREVVEEEAFTGFRGTGEGETEGFYESQVVYGVFQGAKLTYDARRLLTIDSATWPREASGPLSLQILPSIDGEDLVVQVLWRGAPIANAKTTLYGSDGAEVGSSAADDAGRVRFQGAASLKGLLGVLASCTLEGDVGEWMGKKYKGAAHYSTLTFSISRGASGEASRWPDLPEAVASFGGAVLDGWLYVYSGHVGTPHDHSIDNLSTAFRRLRLARPSAWEELPPGPRLQGLPLVACRERLYRIGGLSSRNPSGAPEDLESVADAAAFDPATMEWEAVPPLPKPRSSHDAACLNDCIYVVGGWRRDGDEEEWLNDALVFDPTRPDQGWRSIAPPEAPRRAVAVAAGLGRVFVVGGMTSDNMPTSRVEIYDPATDRWTIGPDAPGHPQMKGFGASAWGQRDRIVVCGADGKVYELRRLEGPWTEVASIGESRIFHRLLPLDDSNFLVVAGARGRDGQTATMLLVSLPGG
jgi:hypothetical protein